jgi:NAD-dependent SIR2 family protein deacetylase
MNFARSDRSDYSPLDGAGMSTTCGVNRLRANDYAWVLLSPRVIEWS